MNGTLLPSLGGLIVFLAGSCRTTSNEPPQRTEQSPNASILPAPLPSVTEPRSHLRSGLAGDVETGRGAWADAAPSAPVEVRDDEPLPADTQPSRDTAGVELTAVWRWRDVPQAPSFPEVNLESVRAARDRTAFSVSIKLSSSGRMRYTLKSNAFRLPSETELRSKQGILGHVLVWSDRTDYRILGPGTLRALFVEGRADATPMVRPKVRLLGAITAAAQPGERLELSTPTGRLLLDQAPLSVGLGGQLLCRLLCELIAARPDNDACEGERVPLHAEFQWPEGGGIFFEVTALATRPDLSADELSVPPSHATLKLGELPPEPDPVLLSETSLSSLRRRAVPSREPPKKDAPLSGLLLVNHSEIPRYFLLDGVAVGWARPHTETKVGGLLSGRYLVSSEDFLGAQPSPPVTVTVPARFVLSGEPDAGR